MNPASEPHVSLFVDRRSLTILGASGATLLRADQTGGVFSLMEVVNPPGTGVPPHAHRHEDETFCILDGLAELTVGGRQMHAGPGDVVFLPRNVPHAYRAAGGRSLRMHVIVTPGGLERFFEELSALPASDPPDMATVSAVCARHGISFVSP